MRTNSPSAVSSRKARLMVMRLKPSWLTSSLSDGTRWCGGQLPFWICWAIICLTRAYSGAGPSPIWATSAETGGVGTENVLVRLNER
ncbi:hypothetical protein D3C75_1068500 [compost metagenome]